MQGGLDYPPADNAAVRDIRRQALIWLREVKTLFEAILTPPDVVAGCAPGLWAVPDLIEAYDIMHRMACGTPCHEYLRKLKLATADRWTRGDRTISATDVALLLLTETDRDIRSIPQRYSGFALDECASWVEELIGRGRFTGIPLQEVYARLTYLIDADLCIYFGDKEKQDKAKARWVKDYFLEDHSGLDTPTLMRYVTFILTASRRGLCVAGPEDGLYRRMWTDYISRPDVHPMFRQAMQLALAQE